MRVIAPEKEVMTGGTSKYSMEGIEGGRLGKLLTARRGRWPDDGLHRGEPKRAATCFAWEGRAAWSQPGSEHQRSQSFPSWGSASVDRYCMTMLGSHGAGRSLWGATHDSHADISLARAFQSSAQSN